MWRRDVRPFSQKQIDLMTTFADQAVIAIENVRLFTELEAKNHDLTEALEQQTATSEILRVISSSPTDVQPVFDTIAESAARLCDGRVRWVTDSTASCSTSAPITTYRRESSSAPARLSHAARAGQRERPSDARPAGRCTFADIATDPEYAAPGLGAGRLSERCSAVPMLRDGTPIGDDHASARTRRGRSRDKQIELLKTFADQAVIAIENVRLFTELEAEQPRPDRGAGAADGDQRDPAGHRQLADRRPAGVRHDRRERRCGCARRTSASVVRFDGELFRTWSRTACSPEGVEALRAISRCGRTRRATHRPGHARARAVVHMPTCWTIPSTRSHDGTGAAATAASLAVPMLREGEPIGVIIVCAARGRARSPTSRSTLLETFADQAVIAIENVRLFRSWRPRNRDLTEALEQQTATSEILQRHQPLADRHPAGASTRSSGARRGCASADRRVHLPVRWRR